MINGTRAVGNLKCFVSIQDDLILSIYNATPDNTAHDHRLGIV